MPDPHQHRFARPLPRKRFRYAVVAVVALLSTVPLFIGLAAAWADESIIIDFVRHAQSADNVAGILGTTPPGAELTDLGDQQAQTVAGVLASEGPYDGIYASELVRTQDTAAPLADMLHNMPVQILPGLNEIGAGIYEGQPVDSLAGLFYALPPVAWTLGLDFVPIPGSTDPNGVAFDESFSNAVRTIYENTISEGGSNPSDVAYSSAGAIATWTLMNVNNPDFAVFLNELLTTGQFLPNAGTVVVSGDPADGFTLVSYDGIPVPPASLPTELFVDVRNLIEAPQFAAYNIGQAIDTGDPTTILTAIQNGVSEVNTATLNFPVAVINDIVNALGGSSLGNVATDLLPAAATELTVLPGDLGTMVSDALTSF